ncbi:MAG: 2-oxo acid dehydrogenase subunit E2 [Clostridia bacterium]|nr:2-oxo acid dehydrogenase subunit E2 [Clostridia bacterium]
MFGKRPDGRRVTGIDPIVQFTPYIMPHRYDAMVNTKEELDFDQMTRYIRDKRREGHEVTHMGMIIAAYLRMLCDYPEMNRFIVNRKLYARNHFCVSFVTLRKTPDDSVEEALCKVQFNLDDTIFDVSRRLAQAIEEARVPEAVNKTDALARTLMKVPYLPNFVVFMARLLDNHGLMPRFIHEASPFHTSLFISNMASLGMNYIYHHIYDFGTTSIFATMGKTEQKVYRNSDGTCRSKRIMPVGVVIDERIASGGIFARMFSTIVKYLNNPELLEVPPEHIKTEIEMKRAPEARQISA